MTVATMMESLTSQELTEWKAYFDMERREHKKRKEQRNGD